LEDLATDMIRDHINITAKEDLGYYELNKHKPCFDERCSKSLDQRKCTKLLWLQYPSKMEGDNLNNKNCKPANISGTKRRNILKTKLMNLQRTVRTRTSQICIEE
jgi:hypothetical protein